MIKLSELAQQIEEGLSNQSSEFPYFHIVADSGKYKKSERVGNNIKTYINGVLSVVNSENSNLVNGSVVATMTCNLKIIVPLQNPDEVIQTGDGKILSSEKTISDLRTVIDGFFQANTQQVLEDEKGDFFLTLSAYRYATTGQRDQTQITGNSFTFSVIIMYMFVQGGLSNLDVKYYIDGRLLPFQAKTDTRTPTMDGNVYADTTNGATKNLASQSTFSISFELPALRNEITEAFFGFLYEGELNEVHIVCIERPYGQTVKRNFYLMTFGEMFGNGELIKNIAFRVTLVECPDDYELLRIHSNIFVLEAIVNGTYANGFNNNAYYYNFMNKEFGYIPKNIEGQAQGNITVQTGDILICTETPINYSSIFEVY